MNFTFDSMAHGQTFVGKSLTMPGQDVSVRYMFSRFVQERPLPVVGQPYFSGDGEESFLHPERMTLQEKLDMKREADQEVERISRELQLQKAAKDAKAKAAVDKELEELRALKAKSEAVQ